MNTSSTTVAYTSESLWNKRTSSDTISEPSKSRRCSNDSGSSIHSRETDQLRDTTDTEWCESDAVRGLEFEPVTEPEEDAPVDGDSSGNSDNEIISTRVIEVLVGDDGDLEFADSEQTASGGSDSEIDFYDYWNCAQCRAENNNPLYRYCEKCFKGECGTSVGTSCLALNEVRKNFFPPRPKRKHKLGAGIFSEPMTRTLSQDSGVESAANSQELSQDLAGTDQVDGSSQSNSEIRLSDNVILSKKNKRRADSLDRNVKRARNEYSAPESESETDRSTEIKPLIKMVSDPVLTVERQDNDTNKDSKQKLDDNMCIMCYSEPKSGVFVHGRIAHICCCYRCARRVWAKAKRCPICNCKVSNVLKAVVM